MSILKTNSSLSNPQLICGKEVVIRLERLSDSVVTEMTAHRSALQSEQVNKMSILQTNSPPCDPQLICGKEIVIRLERLSDSFVAEMTGHRPALQSEQIQDSEDDVLDINSLPNEIILKIMGYFTLNKLKEIARVCRRWNLLSRSTVLWKNVEVELNDYSDQTAIAQSFVNTLPPCVACLQLNFCNRDYWYQSLYFEELSMNLNKRCPHLEMLILKDAELSGSLLSVIDLCTQLLQKVQKLVFYHCSFEYSQIGEGSGTPQIKVLDVSRCLVKNFYNLTFSRMPHLKELRLFGTKVKDYWFEDDSFFNQLHVLDMGETTISPRTLQAIQNHGFNLKKLFLCFTDFRDGYLDFNNSAFPHLKTICLKRCRVTLEGIVSLIKSCQSLENVYVDPDMAQSYAAHPFVIANECKLGIVKFVECVNHRKVGYLCE